MGQVGGYSPSSTRSVALKLVISSSSLTISATEVTAVSNVTKPSAAAYEKRASCTPSTRPTANLAAVAQPSQVMPVTSSATVRIVPSTSAMSPGTSPCTVAPRSIAASSCPGIWSRMPPPITTATALSSSHLVDRPRPIQARPCTTVRSQELVEAGSGISRGERRQRSGQPE